MANNANINKVIYGNDTLIDLTSDTVTQADVLNSKSFHDASGTLRTGTADISGKADLTDLADAFSDEQAYSTGDYVTYDGDLYRFTSNKSAGAWDSTKATQITVADELSVLPSKADKIQLAPEFSTSSSYNAGSYCTFNGKLYRFDSNKSAGDWSYSKVTEVTVGSELRQKENLTSFSSGDFLVVDLAVEHQLPQHNVSLMRADSVSAGGDGVVSADQVTIALNKTANPEMIAPTFSSSQPYAKGDYVTKLDGVVGAKVKLFQFTANHTGSWTGLDVREVEVTTVLNTKVDKVSGKGLSTNDYDNTAKGIVDNIQDNVKANTQLISESIWGENGKNLLKNTLVTTTTNGITISVDSNGIITANGTATANTSFEINYSLPAGSYILNGCNGGTSGTYFIDTYENRWTNRSICYNEDVSFTFTTNSGHVFRCYFANGTTVSDVVFKPMIRKADILDSTYEPYHDGISTNVNANTSLISESIWGESGKNMLPITATTQTINGVTFTMNDDGSITLNNTATANADININADLELIAGQKLLFNFASQNTEDVRLTIYQYIGGTTANTVNCFGEDTGYTVQTTGRHIVYIRAFSGKTYDNLTIYPMIRDADILDDTFEPYHSSVKDILRDAEVIEGKNLLPFHTQTIIDSQNRSFPFVADRNGFMTCSEINDYRAWQYANSNEFLKLAKGRYKIKIVQKTAKTSGYIGFDIFDDAGNVIYACTNETLFAELIANGATFTLSADTNIGVEYKVGNGSYAYMIYKESETDPSYEPYYIPLKDAKVDWASYAKTGVHQWFDFSNVNSGGEKLSGTADNFLIQATSGTWQGTVFRCKVSPNTDYIISSDVTVTSGRGYINVAPYPSGSAIANSNNITSSGKVEFTFNSGNNEAIKIGCFCTGSTDEAGTVGYADFLLKLAFDNNTDFAPYAMTNRELTEKATYKSDTFGQVTVAKVNGVCMFTAITGSSVAEEDGKTLGTLGDAYKPKAEYFLATKGYNGSSYVDAIIKITTAGVVTVQSTNGTAITGINPSFILGRPIYLGANL